MADQTDGAGPGLTSEATDVYRELARRLDALPNRFPATESGVELRVLASMFSLAQARLASVMTGDPAPASEIAARVEATYGVALGEREVRRDLKDMVRDGLIWMRREAGEGRGGPRKRGLQFGLMPFVVGFYEAQLPQLDAKMASLVEAYFQESRALDTPGPSVHRVIPVGEAVKDDVAIQPYDQAVALIEGAKSWGVRDCICRVQQKLVGKGCDAPVEVCLVFAPVENAFGSGGGPDRPLTKQEALAKLREAADAGLVHTVGNYKQDHHYICNCCSCCCGVLRRLTEFEIPGAVATSAYQAHVDAEACIACGNCEERCPVGAITVVDVARVDAAPGGRARPGRCIGCGQCTLVCPTEAIAMVARPAGEVVEVPLDRAAWGAAREAARGGD